MASSAVTAVFATPELVDAIIVFLPRRAILRVQQVKSIWRGMNLEEGFLIHVDKLG